MTNLSKTYESEILVSFLVRIVVTTDAQIDLEIKEVSLDLRDQTIKKMAGIGVDIWILYNDFVILYVYFSISVYQVSAVRQRWT